MVKKDDAFRIKKKFLQFLIGSAILSILLLIGMAFLPWPFEFDIPGKVIFSGEIESSSIDLTLFSSTLRQLIFVDNIFLIGWLFTGFFLGGYLILEEKKQMKLLGFSFLILNTAAVSLDFTENAFQIRMLDILMNNGTVSPSIFEKWEIILLWSYLLIFIGAELFFIVLFISTNKRNEKIQYIVGIIITGLAILGKWVAIISIFSIVWYLLFFIYLIYWSFCRLKLLTDS